MPFKDPEKSKKYHREYYKKYSKKYYAIPDNLEHRKQYGRNYFLQNRAKINERNRLRYKTPKKYILNSNLNPYVPLPVDLNDPNWFEAICANICGGISTSNLPQETFDRYWAELDQRVFHQISSIG